MFKLVISDDEGRTIVVPLLHDEITIGRQEGNTIRLTERNVSRSHARLLRRNGSYVVEDLGSYNGVMLNGERLQTSAELSSGDRLGIGDYALAVQRETIPVEKPPPASQPQSGPPPRLVVLNEPAAGAEFSLRKPVLRIGRDEQLDLWINHKSVSHEHAEIQIQDNVVTVFDLDSANGIRVNGIDTKRAILEQGDVLELGDVRFRFVLPQGTHSLEDLPPASSGPSTPSPSRKPLFVLAVIGLVTAFGGGAIFVTLSRAPGIDLGQGTALESGLRGATPSLGGTADAAAEPATQDRIERAPSPLPTEPVEVLEAPQEWEGQLVLARAKLARGEIDQAYRAANALPKDSDLRRTPEFGEIRYRYAQAHLNTGEAALRGGNTERALREANLVLGVRGITSKQRKDARKLQSQSRQSVAAEVDPEQALAEAHRCVTMGDNTCAIRALEDGRAQSPAALALLIETYRAVDNLRAARKHMRAFVERYPKNARTPRYRQMLASQGSQTRRIVD